MALLRITAVLLLVCAARLGAQAAKASEAQVKAVFLFNFAQFVDWPPEAVPDSQAPLVIGLLGGDPFGDFLDATVRGERRGSRPFAVQRYERVEDISRCDILFISRSAGDRPEEILARLKNRPIPRGPTDEQDVAPRDVFDPLIAMDYEWPCSPMLPAYGGIEEIAERVTTQNPDDQRRLRVRNGLRRPIDELREVEQEDGLHLSLGGPRCLRPQAGGAYQQQGRRDSQKRHAIAPYTPRSISRRAGPGAPNST